MELHLMLMEFLFPYGEYIDFIIIHFFTKVKSAELFRKFALDINFSRFQTHLNK